MKSTHLLASLIIALFANSVFAQTGCNLSVALAGQKSVSTDQQEMLSKFSQLKGYNLVKLDAAELAKDDNGVSYGGINETSFKGQNVDIFMQVTPVTWLTSRSTLLNTDTNVIVSMQNLRSKKDLHVSSSRDVISAFSNADHLIAESLNQLPACGQ